VQQLGYKGVKSTLIYTNIEPVIFGSGDNCDFIEWVTEKPEDIKELL